jgi:hypothetical protein
MNNNFDELILKRRACGRARTASMGAHVLWGAKGGRECLGGREWRVRMPHGVQTWGRERLVGCARPRAPTVKGAHDEGAHVCIGSPAAEG